MCCTVCMVPTVSNNNNHNSMEGSNHSNEASSDNVRDDNDNSANANSTMILSSSSYSGDEDGNSFENALLYSSVHASLLMLSYFVLATWLSYGASECPQFMV